MVNPRGGERSLSFPQAALIMEMAGLGGGKSFSGEELRHGLLDSLQVLVKRDYLRVGPTDANPWLPFYELEHENCHLRLSSEGQRVANQMLLAYEINSRLPSPEEHPENTERQEFTAGLIKHLDST